jgi:dephospho-CoA kinase
MIIALSGYAGSGKDTVGARLVKAHGFRRFAFADKVRELTYATDKRVRLLVDKHGWDEAKKTPYVRAALQNIGQSAREILGPDIWIDQFNRFHKYWKQNIVITDMRYLNEMRRLSMLDHFPVIFARVTREGVGPVNNHPSETELENEDFDYYIQNDRSIEDLHKTVDMIVALNSF